MTACESGRRAAGGLATYYEKKCWALKIKSKNGWEFMRGLYRPAYLWESIEMNENLPILIFRTRSEARSEARCARARLTSCHKDARVVAVVVRIEEVVGGDDAT